MVKTAEALQAVEDEATEASGGGKKKLIIAAVAAVAVLAAVYFLVLAPKPAAEEPVPEPTMTEAAEGEIVPVVTMTANLKGSDLRYARVGFAVVLEAMADPAMVEPRFPMLQDRSLDIIGSHTPQDLTTQEGRDLLRDELTAAAQEIWPDGEVLRVVLTELIVQ